jgi:hypothetical protein
VPFILKILLQKVSHYGFWGEGGELSEKQWAMVWEPPLHSLCHAHNVHIPSYHSQCSFMWPFCRVSPAGKTEVTWCARSAVCCRVLYLHLCTCALTLRLFLPVVLLEYIHASGFQGIVWRIPSKQCSHQLQNNLTAKLCLNCKSYGVTLNP